MKMHLYILIIIYSSTIAFSACPAYAQYYQKADYGDMSATRKNQLGGYDYYDKSGNIAGYSKKTYTGDYVYYDNEGNKLGALKQDKKKDTYTFYSADDTVTGSLRKTPTGEYRYEDKLEGGLRSVTPPPGEDIGFVPPSAFLEGSLKTRPEEPEEEK